MKLTVVLSLVAAATAVSAETNAQRFARGLGPLPPNKRATPVAAARRGQPSGGSGECNTGPVQCCNNYDTAGSGGTLDTLLAAVGVDIPKVRGMGVASGCTAVLGSSNCQQQPLCCNNNDFNGIVSVGCSPININL